jgi:hypothetical protein
MSVHELWREFAGKVTGERAEQAAHAPGASGEGEWSAAEREAVLLGERAGGRALRVKVGAAVGMPAAVACELIAVRKARGAKAAEGAALGRTRVLGTAKKNSTMLQLVGEWLLLDAALTHSALSAMINQEVLRALCAQAGLLRAEEHEVNGSLSPHREAELLRDAEVAKAYGELKVDGRMVGAWLDGYVHSRKYELGAAAINAPPLREQRLATAQALRGLLMTPSACELVFVASAPLQLSMQSPPGALSQPIHQLSHALLAASATDGLLHASSAAREGYGGSETGVEDRVHAGYAPDAARLLHFLNGLCEKLVTRPVLRDLVLVAEADEALMALLERGSETAEELAPHWARLLDKAAEAGKSVRILPLPPCSPLLNFADPLVSQAMRRANEILHELIVNEADYQEFLGALVEEGPHGTRAGKQHHLLLLDKVAYKSFAEMYHLKPQSIERLLGALDAVIAQSGEVKFEAAYDYCCA